MSPVSDVLEAGRALLRARLSEESYAHCERVAAAARELAVRHGVDPDDAELAGLLHDHSRDESDGELLEAADSMGMTILDVEREHPYLLHARVGASRLRAALPGLPEHVLEAVESHTVGAVPMSDLGKVVFLADMVEPARRYAGVDDIRRSCERDPLEECFRRGYAHSVERVRRKGRPLHPVTSVVADRIQAETGRSLADAAEGGS